MWGDAGWSGGSSSGGGNLPPSFSFNTDNFAASNPTATPGTVVTTGASNADGAYVALISTPLAVACQILQIGVHSNNDAATDTSTLLDVGVDLLGGTSYSPLILSLPVGHLPTAAGSTRSVQRVWRLPLIIPAGATIGAMGRNVTGSTRNVTVVCIVHGGATNWWAGAAVDAIGDVRASSKGTDLAPHASANTWGSWVNIGAPTAREYGALAVGVQGETSTAMSATANHIEVGIASTKIGPTFMVNGVTTENVSEMFPAALIHKSIPASTQLQARLKSSVAAQDTLQVILHGITP